MSERDPKTGRFPPSVWGGAKGSGSKRETLPLIGADREQPSPEAKREGQARRRERLERIAEAHDKAIDRLMARIEADEVEARDLNAIVRDTGNRMWGAPTQPLSGPEGGPIQSKIEVAITYADDPIGSETPPPAGAADPDA